MPLWEKPTHQLSQYHFYRDIMLENNKTTLECSYTELPYWEQSTNETLVHCTFGGQSHTGRCSFSTHKARETSCSNQRPFHSLFDVKDSYLGPYRTSEFTDILMRRACLRTVTVGESAMSTTIGDLHSRNSGSKDSSDHGETKGALYALSVAF